MTHNLYLPIPASNENPFIQQIETHISQYGWKAEKINWTLENIIRYRKKIKIIHFHWPEALWRSNFILISYFLAIIFVIKCKFSHLLKYKLVWSTHNILPHTYRSETLEKIMRKWIVQNFDYLIGHSNNAEQELVEFFNIRISNYSLALHGHYEECYLSHEKKETIKKNLKIDNEKVIGILASNKAYKGTEFFISEFIKNSTPNIKLLILGKINNNELVKKIGASNKVIHLNRLLNNKELAKYFLVVDYFALPYTKITTSGAYFLGITLKKTIIAPDLPFFKMHSTPSSLLLYDSKNRVNGIKNCLTRISNGWIANEAELEELKNKFRWEDSTKIIAHAYNNLII